MNDAIDPGQPDDVVARFEELLSEAAALSEPAALPERLRHAEPERNYYLQLLHGEIEPDAYARAIERSVLCREGVEPRWMPVDVTFSGDDQDAPALTLQTVPRHTQSYMRLVEERRRAITPSAPQRVDFRRELHSFAGVMRYGGYMAAVLIPGLILVIASLVTHTIDWTFDFTSAWIGVVLAVAPALLAPYLIRIEVGSASRATPESRAPRR